MLRYFFSVFVLGYVVVFVLAFANVEPAANIVGAVVAAYGIYVSRLLLNHPKRYPDADLRTMRVYANVSAIALATCVVLHVVGIFATSDWQTFLAFSPLLTLVAPVILYGSLKKRPK